MTRVLALLLVLGASAPARAQPSAFGAPTGDRFRHSEEMNEARTREALEELRRSVDRRHPARDSKRSFEERSDEMRQDVSRAVLWGVELFLVGALLAVIAASGAARRRRKERARFDDVGGAPLVSAFPASTFDVATGAIDVTVLRIAIDGRASKFVASELEAIVKAYDGASAESRATRLREASILLRRVRDSWLYGGADNEPMRPRDEALAAVARHVDDARSRVKHPAKISTPLHPPASLVLVSIIVAARGELLSVTDLATGEDLRRALEAAAHRAPDDLIAVELVWVPSEPGATLTSLDIEAHYRTSELHPLPGAMVGKVFCTYCAGPFPGELVTCPHCGAPAPGREHRAS